MHLIVHGKVQGVFYREHVRKAAQKAAIKGFVRNLRDGTVEVVAEASEEKLAELLKECRKGSFMSRVDKIDEQHEDATGEFEEFLVEF